MRYEFAFHIIPSLVNEVLLCHKQPNLRAASAWFMVEEMSVGGEATDGSRVKSRLGEAAVCEVLLPHLPQHGEHRRLLGVGVGVGLGLGLELGLRLGL